jgi:hypothetical protein
VPEIELPVDLHGDLHHQLLWLVVELAMESVVKELAPSEATDLAQLKPTGLVQSRQTLARFAPLTLAAVPKLVLVAAV